MKAILDDFISAFRSDPRQVALRQVARSRGWRYSRRSRFERQPVELQRFELFKGKRGKRVLSMMQMGSKRIDGVFSVYDYIYYGDLKNSATTVYQFQYAGLQMTYFGVRPKGILTTLKELFIKPPRLFATTPEFDERYELTTEDGEALRLQLNEEFLDYVGDEDGWTFEGYDDFLIAYRYGLQIPVEDIEPELEYFERLCERLVNGQRTLDIV